MIWAWLATDHEMAISTWMRTWIRGPFIDRWLLLMVGWGTRWSLGFGILGLIGHATIFLWIAWAPWLFLLVDHFVEKRKVKADLAKLSSRDNVILATRCEYCGGHPRLPHARFTYLTVEGFRENPE